MCVYMLCRLWITHHMSQVIPEALLHHFSSLPLSITTMNNRHSNDEIIRENYVTDRLIEYEK